MATKTKPQRKKKTEWAAINLVHIYRYAKGGMSDEAVARALGINRNTIKLWKKKKPEVREALALARQEVPSEDIASRYFYNRLDPVLQDLWDKLEANDRSESKGGLAAIKQILGDHGRTARQTLFLHALVMTHYSPTRAMEKVGLDKRQLDDWVNNDPDFAELVDQVAWLKGNYFEESLVKLVEAGDPQAIKFVNQTYNKKRGYGRSVEVTGELNHQHTHVGVIDLGDLDLSLECRNEILAAMRARDDKLERDRRISALPDVDRATLQIEAEIQKSAV